MRRPPRLTRKDGNALISNAHDRKSTKPNGGDMSTNDFLKSELIEDREVTQSDEDKLGHETIADQLAGLVQSVKTPANIALYGAWGSGKSGISNLLKSRIAHIHGVKFVRFDAFKYAENPLRRNFISVVATELGIKDPRFHSDLYTGKVNTDFKIPFSSFRSLFCLFFIVISLCTLINVTISGIIAAINGKAFLQEFIDKLIPAFTSSFIPASFLTTLTSVIGKTFVVERKTEKADSDEQFEGLLNDLVEKASVKTLVVFVDELDRCAPINVVATLDAVRTFLGAKKCIFIVASDQQVLEKALTESLQQATPKDRINPYYSAGSAYLDKVFQYHISVPPLLPQSITRFAADIVKDKPGVWELINTDFVVSLLIPSHVRSPRRVKNLLNAFVLSYRLAKALQLKGSLEAKIDERTDELAKLVCLQTEFPLFARDLVVDPKLPEYVLAIVDAEGKPEMAWEKFPNVSIDVKKIAESYALRSAPVDVLLVDDGAAPTESDEQPSEKKEVEKRQGEQLIDYLSRTRIVRNPGRDLIHLQSTGSLFGLEVGTADSIEKDAQNGAIGQIRSVFSDLDAKGKLAAFSFLLQQQKVAVGIERGNIVSSLLVMAEDDELDLSGLADSAIGEACLVLPYNQSLLKPETIFGAWRLALNGTRPERTMLAKSVMDSELVLSDPDVFEILLTNVEFSADIDGGRMSSAFIEYLFNADSNFSKFIASVDAENTRFAFEKFTDAIAERLKSEATKADDDAKKATLKGLLSKFGETIRSLLSSNRSAAESFMRAVLRADNSLCRDEAQKIIAAFRPIQDGELIAATLLSAKPRPLSMWHVWLSSIDSSKVTTANISAINNLISYLIASAMTDGDKRPSDQDITSAATAIVSLIEAYPEIEREAFSQRAVSLGEHAKDEITVAKRVRAIEVANLLIKSGLTTSRDVALQETEALIASLGEEVDFEEEGHALCEYVMTYVPQVMHGWLLDGNLSFIISAEKKIRLIKAVNDCAWLPDPYKKILLLKTMCLTDTLPAELGGLIPSVSELTKFKEEHEESFLEVLSYWLRLTNSGPDEVLPIIKSALEKDETENIIESFSVWRRRLNRTQLVSVLQSFLLNHDQNVQSKALLGAMGFMDAADADIADILARRFDNCGNNHQRKSVLDLWRLSNIKDVKVRKGLLERVLIKFIGLNTSAAETAIAYLYDLAYPIPKGIKGPLGSAMIDAVKQKSDLKDRVVAVLKRMGYRSEMKGIPGFRKETIDISAEEEGDSQINE